MNQVITINWWNTNPNLEIAETDKNELDEYATIHIHRMVNQGLNSGDLAYQSDHNSYQGWWGLYSSDRNNLSRKIYDDIDSECITDTDTVKMSQVENVLEKYLGRI